jgi:hypothetical protein
VTNHPSGRQRRSADRHRDDTGGVWITTGVVLGIVLYAFIVLMLVAGFQAVLPLVILPPVVLGLIAANSLLGGGRSYGRSVGKPEGQGQAPLTSSGPGGPRKPDAAMQANGAGASSGKGTAEEPHPPR